MIDDRSWIKRVTRRRFELASASPTAFGEFSSFFFFTHDPPRPRRRTGRISTSAAIKAEGSRSARKSRLVSLRCVVRALPSVAVRRPLSIRAPASSSPTPNPPSLPSRPPPVPRFPGAVVPSTLSRYPRPTATATVPSPCV